MPRYTFDLGVTPPLSHHDGVYLPDLVEARREALRYAGAALREHPAAATEAWWVEVKDEETGVSLTQRFCPSEAAALQMALKATRKARMRVAAPARLETSTLN